MLSALQGPHAAVYIYSWIHAAAGHAQALLQTQSKAGNLQHAWTDKMTESVISGAGRSFGWQLKIGNFKILTYAKPVPKAKL